MAVEFKITTDNTQEVIDRTKMAVLRFLEEAGQHLESEAKKELENDPRRIDTGRLRNSITHQLASEEKAVYVGTNVEYGIYVHEGTRRMAPNRFLRNAFERNTEQIEAKLKEALENA